MGLSNFEVVYLLLAKKIMEDCLMPSLWVSWSYLASHWWKKFMWLCGPLSFARLLVHFLPIFQLALSHTFASEYKSKSRWFVERSWLSLSPIWVLPFLQSVCRPCRYKDKLQMSIKHISYLEVVSIGTSRQGFSFSFFLFLTVIVLFI